MVLTDARNKVLIDVLFDGIFEMIQPRHGLTLDAGFVATTEPHENLHKVGAYPPSLLTCHVLPNYDTSDAI